MRGIERRRFGFAGVFAGLVVAVVAAAPTRAGSAPPLPWRQVSVLLGPSMLPGSQVSAEFADAATGRVLFALHPTLAVPPASTLKLLVASTALADLGPGFRFATRVAGVADAHGVVAGNLYLVGSGDPSLNVGDLRALARVVARRVRRVDGSVLVDDTWFAGPYGQGWDPGDNAYGWQAIPDALTLDQGEVVATVRPGRTVGAPARLSVAPQIGVTVVDQATTGAADGGDSLSAARPPVGAGIVVQGRIALGSSPVRLGASVADPSLWAASVFRLLLREQGVAVAGGAGVGRAPAGLPVLAVHRSYSLAALLVHQDRWSINVSAEDLLRAVGARVYGAPGTAANGVRAEQAWLRRQGIAWDGREVDGSGLSLDDRVSARDLVDLLLHVEREPWFHDLLVSLPVAGAVGAPSGTLGEIGLFAGFHGYVRAKTGDVGAAENLAGYVRAGNGRLAVFALLVNGQPGWQAGWRAEERAVEAVAGG